MVKKLVQDGAILMRLRTRFCREGLRFRRTGQDYFLKQTHGTWFLLNEAGEVVRSAKRDGYETETLRQLAQRIGLLAAWER